MAMRDSQQLAHNGACTGACTTGGHPAAIMINQSKLSALIWQHSVRVAAAGNYLCVLNRACLTVHSEGRTSKGPRLLNASSLQQ